MQSFQHLAPLMMERDFMSNDSRVWYALDINAESSLASCSPPRPSNCGVAFAELWQLLQWDEFNIFRFQAYQSTKKSSFPSSGACKGGPSISHLTATSTSVLASLNLADPLAFSTSPSSNSIGRNSEHDRPSFLTPSWNLFMSSN